MPKNENNIGQGKEVCQRAVPYQPAFLAFTALCCDVQAGALLEYEIVGAEHYCHRIKYSTSKIVGPITFFLKNSIHANEATDFTYVSS